MLGLAGVHSVFGTVFSIDPFLQKGVGCWVVAPGVVAAP